MTRLKFALYTLGSVGVYLIVVLGVPTIFPDLNLVQPAGAVQFLVFVFDYWKTFALGRLLPLMAYFFLALFSPDFSISLFYGAFYAVVLLWMWAEVQRLRYFRHSGWWFLLNFIPYVAVGFYLYLLFRPSPITETGPAFESEDELLQKEEMGNCPDCGTPRRNGSAFCPSCGHKLAD